MQTPLAPNSTVRLMGRATHHWLLFVLVFFIAASTALAQQDEQTEQQQDEKAATTTREDMATQEQKTDAPAKSIVRGRVIYDDTNRPVRRARVILLKTDGGGGMDKTGATNERGEFEVKALPAGDYFIMVDSPGIITPLSSIDLYEGMNEKAALLSISKEFEKISVNGTNSVNVQVRARRGGVVSGRVTYSDGDPAIGAQIIIMRKKDNNLARFMTGFSPTTLILRTDDRGVYRIAGLPPGDYVLGASETNMNGDARDEYAGMNFFGNTNLTVSYYQNETSRRLATPVKVVSGQEANDINITLIDRATYSVTGTVVSRQGRAGVRAHLTIQNKSEMSGLPFMDSGPTADSDEQGRWTFTNIPDGTYVITAEPVYYGTSADMVTTDEEGETRTPATTPAPPKPALVARRQEVTISGGDLSNVVIEVSEGGMVRGTLSVESGDKKVPQGMTVALSARNGDTSSDRYGYVQPSGEFVIDRVPPGEFLLNMSVTSDKLYVKSITAGGTDLMRDALKIGSGATVENVRIILSSDVGTIQGRVVSSTDKKGVPRLGVLAVPSDPGRWRLPSSYLLSATDAEGAFKIACAPGSYLVIALGEGEDVRLVNEAFIKARAAAARSVTVQANASETVELVAPVAAP
jgi:hypothetical protein